MGRVIAVANQKGGVAKTTTVANLAAALSEAGARVLMLDMDPQGSLTLWSGHNPDALDKSLYDSLIKGLDSREILLSTPLGADLLPASIDLSLAEMELVGMVARERRLGGVLAPLRDRYDYVLVDCQPSLGLLTVNAFAAADAVLVPVACEFLSTRAIQVLLRMVRKVQLRLNSQLVVAGILPTLFDRRTRHAQQELEALVQQFGHETPVLVDCAVPRSIRFAEAAAAGKSILAFAPLHPGAEAYRRLARAIAPGLEAREAPAAGAGGGLALLDTDGPRVDVFVRKGTAARRWPRR
ncbi:MAG: ParA family protein [Limnochordales bacterium]|nr:ParA family protein [Limnochordales bacterium]